MIFDLWRPRNNESIIEFAKKELERVDKAFVFVSHAHKDHYNPQIFELPRHLGIPVEFIISSDVAQRARLYYNHASIYKGPRRIDASEVHILRPGDEFSAGDISVKAFPSTDTGNCYLVKLFSKTYYHAGDNNAWLWSKNQKDDSKMMSNYLDILREIKTYLGGTIVDEAMVPVDSRSGACEQIGLSLFSHLIGTRQIHPMHSDNPPVC